MPGLHTLLTRISISQDIIILTECWLSCNPNIPTLDGYNHYTTTRSLNKNDGIVIYVRNNITNVSLKEIEFCDANCMQIRIGNDMSIFAIY